MNTLTELSNPPSPATAEADSAPFFVRGKLIEGSDSIQRSRDLGVDFAVPRLDLNAAIHPRSEVPPLLNVPLAEIIDFLVESGQRMIDGKNPYIEACVDRMAKVSLQSRAMIDQQMKGAVAYLDRKVLREVVEQNFPNPRALDEWIPHNDHQGRRSFIRAFAPRLIHVLPGNSPGIGIKSIAPGRAGQGGQPVQDGLGRSFLDCRLPANHGRCRPRPPAGPVDVGNLLARRRRSGRADRLSPAIF